ncbi:hypothetical protein L1887_47060 [Cichorium endivia]|nr:hypothetical protein L1887_47060 [Cichorium endivia]
MIGRADIEGSKSNVAMNAWLPQASYPCGNFSDTSSFKFRRSKGSLGHAFTVRIRTGNQNQTSFYPSVPHEISVLVELILGHLRYLLTDVPPQPNSPPDNVFRPDRPAEAGLGSKKRGIAPLPIHGISKITLKVVVFHFRPRAPTYTTPLKSFHKVGLESSSTGRIPLVRTSSELAVRRPGKAPEGAVPSPSPGRHAATRSRRGSSSSSPPTADGFGTGTPVPSPQSQSFSRGYGSILPTSLAYIVPSTRGCSPWRPDAVMSTTGRGRHSVLRIFKGRRGRTGHRATCGALPAAGPYLRLSHPHRRPLRPGSRPRFCSDRRALLLIGAWHLPRRPGVGRALKRHPFSGLVDSAGELARSCNPASGSSRIASSAYQKWPTWSSRFRGTAQRSSRAVLPYLNYPEGNFGGNQLLDGSISLSPLYPSQTNDCTSVSLRASTRVSSGFAPLRHSSPSFGSRQACSHSNPSQKIKTPWSVFQDGPNGVPTGRCREHAGISPRRRVLPTTIDATASPRAYRQLGLWPPHQSAPVHAPSRSADRLSPFHIRPGRIAGPHSLPSRQFQALFDSLFKVLFIFPSRYLFAIGLTPVFSLGRIYRPIGAAFPNNPTRRQRLVVRQGPGTTGLSPSLAPPSRGLGPGPPLRTLLQTTIRTARPSDFQAGLIPVRSPLLRESL